jgi:hypothetical protein
VLSKALAAAVAALRSMRATWHYGGATRSGRPESAIRGYERSLELVSPERVNVEAPWCRSLIPLALMGYCEAAQRLGQPEKVAATLARWRPVYLRWLERPLSDDERRMLRRLEALRNPF